MIPIGVICVSTTNNCKAGTSDFLRRRVIVHGSGDVACITCCEPSGFRFGSGTVLSVPSTKVSLTDRQGRTSLPTISRTAVSVGAIKGREATTNVSTLASSEPYPLAQGGLKDLEKVSATSSVTVTTVRVRRAETGLALGVLVREMVVTLLDTRERYTVLPLSESTCSNKGERGDITYEHVEQQGPVNKKGIEQGDCIAHACDNDTHCIAMGCGTDYKTVREQDSSSTPSIDLCRCTDIFLKGGITCHATSVTVIPT